MNYKSFCAMLLMLLLPCGAVAELKPADIGKTVAVYRSVEGKTVSASFDLVRNTVTVTLPGESESVTLPVAVSGSGTRYSNGKETFWEHQGSGRFFRGETLLFEGTLVETEKR